MELLYILRIRFIERIAKLDYLQIFAFLLMLDNYMALESNLATT